MTDTIAEVQALRAGSAVNVVGTVKIAKEVRHIAGTSAKTGKDYAFDTQWFLIEDASGDAIGVEASSLKRWVREGDVVSLTSSEDGRKGAAVRIWTTDQGEDRRSIRVMGSYCRVEGSCPLCGHDLGATPEAAAAVVGGEVVSSDNAYPDHPGDEMDDDIPF